MRIAITERHTSVTAAVKEYATEKAGKLVRFYDRISSIDIILDGAHDQAGVEMIVKVDGAEDFIAHQSSDDYFAGVDLVLDKLERQITKHKEKLRNRKHLSKKPRSRATEQSKALEGEAEIE